MKKLTIVKIGGNIIENELELDSFLKDFSLLEGRKVLVHGGGKIATQMAEKMGVSTEMIDGRRITNDEMIDVVTATYGGLLNKKIVSKLQHHDCNGIGLTGADGNLILAEKRPVKNGIDYGWAGDIIQVNTGLMNVLLQEKLVPVIAPLTHNGIGNLLNTNADTIAESIAVGMGDFFEVNLNYCFELPGVMLDIQDSNSLIQKLDQDTFLKMKSKGLINQGMLPKLEQALRAAQAKNVQVRILKSDQLLNIQSDDFNEYTEIS